MASLLEYFPNQKYIDRKLAPEAMSASVVGHLARAQKQAVSSGLLDPYVASYMLPIAMVEGHDGQLGILPHSYPPNAARHAMFGKMGLSVADWKSGKKSDINYNKGKGEIFATNGYWIPTSSSRGPRSDEISAKMMPVILAEKAKQYGNENAIERWNGKGRAIEETYDEYMQADSANHKRKVMEAYAALHRPENYKLLDLYMKSQGKQRWE